MFTFVRVNPIVRRFVPAFLSAVMLGSLLSSALVAGGCSTRHRLSANDTLVDALNPELPMQSRIRALDELGNEIESGSRDIASVRESLKTLAWSRRLGQSIRVGALRTLLRDRTNEGLADSSRLVRLMLPTERDPLVISLLSEASVKNNWTETTPAMVRSLARVFDGIEDAERAEYDALTRLHPERSIQETTFGVFVEPGPDADAFMGDLRGRTRRGAWNLLSRLDSDGAIRVGLLADLVGDDERVQTDPGLASLAAGLTELRIIPLSGEELEWLQSLHEAKSSGDRAARRWWSDSVRAVASLDPKQRSGLRLRHVEPIRWVAKHKPGWLTLSRERVFEELLSASTGWAVHKRSSSRRTQALDGWQDASWPDLLTVLVMDQAVRQIRVADALLAQADEDRSDPTTEFGGLLEADPERDPRDGNGFRAILYKPRPIMREGDRVFVASREMIAEGGRSLAHYHLHAQKVSNGAYAGPSEGDLSYASRYGRTCVVFTSLRDGVLNADLYTPDQRVLDLGEVSIEGSVGSASGD